MIVREFMVNAGCERDFGLVFEPGGVWPELLQPRSDGYTGTKLQVVSERRYIVRDWWKSHRDFEFFRAQYQHDIEEFRKWLAGKDMVALETLLGAFYSDEPDEDGDLTVGGRR